MFNFLEVIRSCIVFFMYLVTKLNDAALAGGRMTDEEYGLYEMGT